jgi:hypothetical protein
MSASTSLAIRQKIEAAVRAYLLARVASAGTTALTGVGIVLRQEVIDLRLPRVLVEVLRAPVFEDMDELYMAELMVAVATDAAATDAAAQHTLRVGLLSEWMADRASFLAYVATGARPWITPAPTPGGAPVEGLVVHSIFPQDEQGEQVQQAATGFWLDAVAYVVPAQLESTP